MKNSYKLATSSPRLIDSLHLKVDTSC